MYIFATVSVITVVTDLILAESKVLNLMPKDSTLSDSGAQIVSKEGPPLSTSPKSVDNNRLLNSMWVYRPNSHPAAFDDENVVQERVGFRPGVTVTRLAKSLYYGFDPYFHKVYFEPFEARSKPIRLVALKRNGKTPREKIRMAVSGQTPDVAELQSPFNEVGTFWLEENVMQQ